MDNITVRNVIERFAESGDAGWRLDPHEYPHEHTRLFQVLTNYPHVIMVTNAAQEWYLLNRNKLRVKVVTTEVNDEAQTDARQDA